MFIQKIKEVCLTLRPLKPKYLYIIILYCILYHIAVTKNSKHVLGTRIGAHFMFFVITVNLVDQYKFANNKPSKQNK